MKLRFCPFAEKLTVVAPSDGLVILFEDHEKEIALQVVQSLIDMDLEEIEELMDIIHAMKRIKETIQ